MYKLSITDPQSHMKETLYTHPYIRTILFLKKKNLELKNPPAKEKKKSNILMPQIFISLPWFLAPYSTEHRSNSAIDFCLSACCLTI